ncbi:GL20551 [Drosophila persimilis]|uniref:GL20551 n=1 Tax=Drosophila persimilis TaxID=7234 RepID=B4G7I3_DROPE|nr:GL20551 [Drosophila persimilis]
MNWNRRNTSEISIHNYPEHLNPFYENDNHKRLRFWNFSKEGNNKRRSFSIGNLKNIWSSYSLSPKKSSTLGINKTSESPPILRKNVNNNAWKMRENDLDSSTPNLKGFGEEFHRRLSQSSLSSNNPFECEVNTDFNIPISNKKYRKKRRAPQPPSPLVRLHTF